nr:hypothetical protein [Escherichia coli]
MLPLAPRLDAILEPAFHVPSRKLLESMAPPPLNPWPVLVSAVRFTSPNDDFSAVWRIPHFRREVAGVHWRWWCDSFHRVHHWMNGLRHQEQRQYRDKSIEC